MVYGECLVFLLLFDCARQEEQEKEESQVYVGCCRSLRLVRRSPFETERCFALFLAFVSLYWKRWSCLQFPTFRFALVLTRWLVFNIFSLLCRLLFFFLFVGEDFMDSCNFLYVLRAMPVFGVLSVNWEMWCSSCNFCFCCLLFSSSTYFCLSMLQFVSEVFMDSCNYPYVLCAMSVFAVLFVDWEMWCFSYNFCFCCIVSSFSPFLCLPLPQFVSEGFIDLCNYPYVFLAMAVFGVFLSPGGCSFCYVPPVFAFFYLRLFLTSACLCFSLSVKPSWICAITPTCFVL